MMQQASVFDNDDLKQFVESAGKALQAEDRYLLDCAAAQRWRIKTGILENRNERYLQFIIWRELRRSFRWRPEIERRNFDLALCDDHTDKVAAFVEIKCWWSDAGDLEIAGIRRDIEEKLGVLGIPAVMLIITWNYK